MLSQGGFNICRFLWLGQLQLYICIHLYKCTHIYTHMCIVYAYMCTWIQHICIHIYVYLHLLWPNKSSRYMSGKKKTWVLNEIRCVYGIATIQNITFVSWAFIIWKINTTVTAMDSIQFHNQLVHVLLV